MKSSAFEAIFLITVLGLSSSGMKLWIASAVAVIITIFIVGLVIVRVLNVNTICLQNEVLYECIDDQNGFLQWNVRENLSSVNLFSYGYTVYSGRTNHTKSIGSSIISAQLIYRNSTFLSSVLTITNIRSLRGDIMIEGTEEIKSLPDSILYTDISGMILVVTA